MDSIGILCFIVRFYLLQLFCKFESIPDYGSEKITVIVPLALERPMGFCYAQLCNILRCYCINCEQLYMHNKIYFDMGFFHYHRPLEMGCPEAKDVLLWYMPLVIEVQDAAELYIEYRSLHFWEDTTNIEEEDGEVHDEEEEEEEEAESEDESAYEADKDIYEDKDEESDFSFDNSDFED